jgi:hypothetical protein
LPDGSLLRQRHNAVLIKHTVWYSEGSVAELQAKAATGMAGILRDEDPINRVNRRHFAAAAA